MPIYEFECKMGHRFSKFCSLADWDRLVKEGIPCEGTIGTGFAHIIGDEFGNGRAYLAWSLPAKMQLGKPTIVFINPSTGQAQVAVHEHEQPPPGFIKEELKSSIERSKFENVQNQIAAEEDAIYNENIRQKREEARRSIIDNTIAHASSDASSSDNPSATEALMKSAIEHIRKKPEVRRKRKTEFRLDVNHLDKTNL